MNSLICIAIQLNFILKQGRFPDDEKKQRFHYLCRPSVEKCWKGKLQALEIMEQFELVGTGRFELPICGRERQAERESACKMLSEAPIGESKDLTPAPRTLLFVRLRCASAYRPWGASWGGSNTLLPISKLFT
jgi:hypothetical protein